MKNALTTIHQTEEFAGVVNMIRQAHRDVMRMANTALIDLYWNLGKHISERVSAAAWGKGVVAQLAKYISDNEPDTRGFSAQNLWRMKQFYETYCNNEKLSLIMREISWTNNIVIMSKAKSDEEKEFYMRLCVSERLKTKELERQFASCLYERTVLGEPKLSTALREIAPETATVFRDTYIMEFISGREAKPENDMRCWWWVCGGKCVNLLGGWRNGGGGSDGETEKLADAIGVDSTTYSRIEKGERRPKEEQLPTLAKMLDVETTELYSLLVADKMAVAVGDAPNEIADMAISILHNNI